MTESHDAATCPVCEWREKQEPQMTKSLTNEPRKKVIEGGWLRVGDTLVEQGERYHILRVLRQDGKVYGIDCRSFTLRSGDHKGARVTGREISENMNYLVVLGQGPQLSHDNIGVLRNAAADAHTQ